MPNTLAHIGIQGLVTRALIREADAKWIMAGCVIPDLPWIFRRAAGALFSIDPYDLKLYGVAQASLLVCGVGALALASLSRRRHTTAMILGLNALLHLLLDALQTKWANGVHLLAPLEWRPVAWGRFWPESPVTWVLTGLGLLWFFDQWRKRHRLPEQPVWRPVVLAALLIAYLALPLAFKAGAERADNHFVKTLRDVPARAGKPIELDRAGWVLEQGRPVLVTFAGERIPARGLTGPFGRKVSVRGVFEADGAIRVTAAHFHPAHLRDAASWVGLALIVAYWLAPVAAAWRPAAPQRPVGSRREDA